jgi:uncharacterized RDD family membrane protein YckC
MSAALIAALLLSVSAYIHTRSADPSRRPAHPLADHGWRALAFVALVAWGAMVAKLFMQDGWANGLAALLGSFALNWYFGHRGPRPTWPGLSMLFGAVGLALATYAIIRE